MLEANNQAPISLSGVSVFSQPIVGGGRVNFQPVLMSTGSLIVHFKFTQSVTHPGATVADFAGNRCCSNMGDFKANLSPGVTWYCHGLVTTTAGVANNGGTSDYVYWAKELR